MLPEGDILPGEFLNRLIKVSGVADDKSGEKSLSNEVFGRDRGRLVAYIIDNKAAGQNKNEGMDGITARQEIWKTARAFRSARYAAVDEGIEAIEWNDEKLKKAPAQQANRGKYRFNKKSG